VLIAPFGVFDPAAPVADVFAQRPGARSAALSAKPEELDGWLAVPEGEDPVEWEVLQLRANIAAAKILWPLGDTRLALRLPRIEAPTLLVWGDRDRVIPPTYAKRLAAAISGPTRTRSIKGAGHLAEFDAPAPVARAVDGFLSG
jgi:pimeloyl-ACP methyl ester carboxylesterase